jgi:hypothetical protein
MLPQFNGLAAAMHLRPATNVGAASRQHGTSTTTAAARQKRQPSERAVSPMAVANTAPYGSTKRQSTVSPAIAGTANMSTAAEERRSPATPLFTLASQALFAHEHHQYVCRH